MGVVVPKDVFSAWDKLGMYSPATMVVMLAADGGSARKSSPRTQFRKNVVTVAAEKKQAVEEVYPTHLQRLETSTIMVAVTPPQPLGRTGPKIKYIRKRATPMVQKVGVGNKRRKTAAGRFAKKGDGAK